MLPQWLQWMKTGFERKLWIRYGLIYRIFWSCYCWSNLIMSCFIFSEYLFHKDNVWLPKVTFLGLMLQLLFIFEPFNKEPTSKYFSNILSPPSRWFSPWRTFSYEMDNNKCLVATSFSTEESDGVYNWVTGFVITLSKWTFTFRILTLSG